MNFRNRVKFNKFFVLKDLIRLQTILPDFTLNNNMCILSTVECYFIMKQQSVFFIFMNKNIEWKIATTLL